MFFLSLRVYRSFMLKIIVTIVIISLFYVSLSENLFLIMSE